MLAYWFPSLDGSIIIYPSFIILPAYLIYNGFYIVGLILLLLALYFFYKGEKNRKEEEAQNKKREKIKARKKEEKLKKEQHKERLKVDHQYAKLHKEKLVDCDDGVSRIYQESSNGIIIDQDTFADDFNYTYYLMNWLNKDIKSSRIIKVRTIESINHRPNEYEIIDKTILNQKWFSEDGVTLNAKNIILYDSKYKLIDNQKDLSEDDLNHLHPESNAIIFDTLGPKPKAKESQKNYREKYRRLICINGFIFEKTSPLKLFSGKINDIVFIDGLSKENCKEKYIAATGKSEKEFEKFLETRKSIEKHLSNFIENNEQYAFSKKDLTIIDELTYVGEEKKIFNGYEIIETFDDGKPKKIVKYKDGKRTNEYKEHPFDFNPPKS